MLATLHNDTLLHPSFIGSWFIGHHEIDENTTKGTPDCAGSHQFGSASPVPKSLVSLSWNNRHTRFGEGMLTQNLGDSRKKSPQQNGAILVYCAKTNGQKESRNNLEKQVDPCFFIWSSGSCLVAEVQETIHFHINLLRSWSLEHVKSSKSSHPRTTLILSHLVIHR